MFVLLKTLLKCHKYSIIQIHGLLVCFKYFKSQKINWISVLLRKKR